MKARLYRMVTKEHICPFGIKSKHLLKSKNFEIEDNHLKTRQETDDFKEKYGVTTTPQTFIQNERIGGYDELLKYFNKSSLKQSGITYQPIIATFAMTHLMAIAMTVRTYESFSIIVFVQYFIALSMCVLAVFKLRDLFSFTNQFITYDILGRKFLSYAYVYPFAEAIAGIGMLFNEFLIIPAVVAISIGLIGSISVIKAVYIEKRELKCACVGGDSNVPLGLISLTENLMMLLMGSWILFNRFL
jgi:glutaredoxin